MGAEAVSNIQGQLSDLFFNHQHERYDDAMREGGEDGPTDAEVREAILNDARDFVGFYPQAAAAANGGIDPTAEDLADDFMRRL